MERKYNKTRLILYLVSTISIILVVCMINTHLTNKKLLNDENIVNFAKNYIPEDRTIVELKDLYTEDNDHGNMIYFEYIYTIDISDKKYTSETDRIVIKDIKDEYINKNFNNIIDRNDKRSEIIVLSLIIIFIFIFVICWLVDELEYSKYDINYFKVR